MNTSQFVCPPHRLLRIMYEFFLIFCKGQNLHEYAKLTWPNFFGKTCFSLNMQTFFISVGFRWTEMNVNGVGVFLVHSRVNQNCSSSLE